MTKRTEYAFNYAFTRMLEAILIIFVTILVWGIVAIMLLITAKSMGLDFFAAASPYIAFLVIIAYYVLYEKGKQKYDDMQHTRTEGYHL